MASPTAEEEAGPAPAAADEPEVGGAASAPSAASSDVENDASAVGVGNDADADDNKRARAEESAEDDSSKDGGSKKARVEDGQVGATDDTAGDGAADDTAGDGAGDATERYQKKYQEKYVSIKESFRRAMEDNDVKSSMIEGLLESFVCKSLIATCARNVDPTDAKRTESRKQNEESGGIEDTSRCPNNNTVNVLVRTNLGLEERLKRVEGQVALLMAGKNNTPRARPNSKTTLRKQIEDAVEVRVASLMAGEKTSRASNSAEKAGRKRKRQRKSSSSGDAASSLGEPPKHDWPSVRKLLEESNDPLSRFVIWHSHRASLAFEHYKNQPGVKQQIPRRDTKLHSYMKVFVKQMIQFAGEDVEERPRGIAGQPPRQLDLAIGAWELSVQRVGEKAISNAMDLMGGRTPSFSGVRDYKFDKGVRNYEVEC